MPLESYIEAEILSTCSALGCTVKGTYQKSSDCIECLKDLIRYLKRDDEDHSVLRYLGSIKLLQTDLLPILKQYSDQKQILDLILRLLVIITNPALLLFKEDLPEDKLSNNIYLEIVGFLQRYKEAFTDISVWSVLNNCLQDFLQVSYAERDEDDRLTVERILIVVRNVLHVTPDYSGEKRTDDDVNVHDQVLWALHMSGMEDLLMYLSGSEDEDQYCLHVLEIISLMLREHKPETLASAGSHRSASEKETDEKRLAAVRKKEELMKVQKIRALTSTRFSGTFYVKNMKSISNREYISHKLITDSHAVRFDLEKSGKRRPKNRLPVVDNEISRRSTLSVCLFLKNFCIEFLSNSYNLLMSLVKKRLTMERSEDHDESYYLWAMSYFMEFNRLHNFQLAVVSETISVQSFHYIQTQLFNYYDMMLPDKKRMRIWSKRMHLSLKSYKELLSTLLVMSTSQDETVVRCANMIKGNIFYVVEYREMLLTLLSIFDEVKFSLAYLKDLVEATHVFLRMLEKYGKAHSHFMVQKKARKQRRRKKKKAEVDNTQNDEQPALGWDAISGEMSAILQGRGTILLDVTPFDAASELTIEEQKTEAVYKIFDAMEKKEVGAAVALLRAAREVWPEDNVFGSPDIEPEEEFLALREIFLANLKREPPPVVENEEESDAEDEEAEEDYTSTYSEQKMDLEDFFKRFAHPRVVQPYCMLLSNYTKNTSYTNRCVVKMLHRIAWDCKMHGLLFQASVFLVFQKILNEPDPHVDPSIKELAKFAKYIVSKFFSVVEKNKKAFVELMFWKGPREVYEMEEGYGSYNSTSSKVAWTEEEEEELKYLYEENKNAINDGEDVVEVIRKLLKNEKTNRQIIYKLKHLNLVDNVKSLYPKRGKKEWLEEEILELQHLFEEYRSSDDVMEKLMKYMTVKKSKQLIINKLLEMHLIADRKELWKKRPKKQTSSHSKKRTYGSGSESASGSESPDSVDEYDDHNFDGNSESSGIEKEITQAEEKNDWSKKELAELSSLLEKYKDSPNFINSIIDELPYKATLKNIVSKLSEMSLINPDDENVVLSLQNAVSAKSTKLDKKRTHTTKPVQKRAKTKDWLESEIVELSHLFQQHKESGNIMENILTNLTVKRSKKAVVEKLVESGLVSDLKILRKKRASTKSHKDTSNGTPPNKNSSHLKTAEGASKSDVNEKGKIPASRGAALEKLKQQKEQKKKKNKVQSSDASEQPKKIIQNSTQEPKSKRHLILGESDSSDDEPLFTLKNSLPRTVTALKETEDMRSSRYENKYLQSNVKHKQKHTVLADSESSEEETLLQLKKSLKDKQSDEHLGEGEAKGLSNAIAERKRKTNRIFDESDLSDDEPLSSIQNSIPKIQPLVEAMVSSKSGVSGLQNVNRREKRKANVILDSDSSEDETVMSKMKNSSRDSLEDSFENRISNAKDIRGDVNGQNLPKMFANGLQNSEGHLINEYDNEGVGEVIPAFEPHDPDSSLKDMHASRNGVQSLINSDMQFGSEIFDGTSLNEIKDSVLKDHNVLESSEEKSDVQNSHITRYNINGTSENVTPHGTEKVLKDRYTSQSEAKENRKRSLVGSESDSSGTEEIVKKKGLKKKRVQILDDSD